MKKTVYRIDDVVEVVNPIRVLRSGYPISYDAIHDMVAKDHNIQQKINDFLKSLELPAHERYCKKLTHIAAHATVAKLGFGGTERKLFTEPFTVNPGNRFVVEEKKIVKTGTYYPANSWQGYEGDWDYEPGGLDKMKTHVLLSLRTDDYNSGLKMVTDFYSPGILRGLWVEAVNVKHK